jgi:hypothetical protein
MISTTNLKTQFKYQSLEYQNRELLREIEKEILYCYNHLCLRKFDITRYINTLCNVNTMCEMITYFVELGYKCDAELDHNRITYKYFYLMV